MAEAAFPKVSIIVAARNNEETIEECLKAVLAQTYPEDSIEVIVMDGGSKDATVKIAEKYPVKVFSIRLNAPAAYNYAMKIAIHPILGFVDADAKVEKDWLKKLVPRLDEPKVAGVSGNIETWNSENPWARSIGYELKTRYSRIGKYTGRIATMNLLLKKRVIEEVGGFDEKLPSQYDTEFGFRISARGYRIAYEPSATCYHFNSPTVRAYFRQQMQYGKNTIKLYFKHSTFSEGRRDYGFRHEHPACTAPSCNRRFLLGILEVLRPLWYVSALLLLAMFVYYVYSAAKISVKFKDRSAMRLVVLYYVRAFAWIGGATVTTVKYLGGKER